MRWETGGKVPTLTTRSLLYHVDGGRFLSSGEQFQLQGWSASELVVPEGATDLRLRSMAGDMMSVPAIGAVLMAALASVDQGCPAE